METTNSLAEIESTVEAFLPDAVSTLGRLNAVHVFQVAVSLAPSIIKVCMRISYTLVFLFFTLLHFFSANDKFYFFFVVNIIFFL